jgi:hypothetical protein
MGSEKISSNNKGKRLHGILRWRWKVDIKIHLREIGCENVNWFGLAFSCLLQSWSKMTYECFHLFGVGGPPGGKVQE